MSRTIQILGKSCTRTVMGIIITLTPSKRFANQAKRNEFLSIWQIEMVDLKTNIESPFESSLDNELRILAAHEDFLFVPLYIFRPSIKLVRFRMVA